MSHPAKQILVAAHDAGGAEIVSAWVRKQRDIRFEYILDGPAVAIFRRKLGIVDIVPQFAIQERIRASEFVLTGTGYSSEFEKLVIQAAKKDSIPVAAYLDHWTSYTERFEKDGKVVLPDEIWAGDSYAVLLAQELFSGITVKFVENEFFREMREAVAALTPVADSHDGTRILYVTEPTSIAAEKAHGDPRYWGYTEFEALDGFLSYVEESRVSSAVMIRCHPAEPLRKYDTVIAKHRAILSITVSAGRTLAEDCAWADWVVGCDSMAMVLAFHAGKEVFSSIPKGGPPLSLPYPEIVPLFNHSAPFREWGFRRT